MFNLSRTNTKHLFFAVISSIVLSALIVTTPLSGLPLAFIGLSYGLLQASFVALITVSLIAFISPMLAFSLGLMMFAPTLLLLRFALLSRAIPDSSDYEFYPFGHLILWATAITSIGSAALFLSYASVPGGLAGIITNILWQIPEIRANLQNVYSISSQADMQAIASLIIIAGLSSWPLLLLGNLHVGQTLAQFLGRNLRPTPDYEVLRLPAWLTVILFICLAGGLWQSSQMGTSWVGDLLLTVAAICLMAYFLLGLIIIHAISHGWQGRMFALSALYFLVLMLTWVIIPISLVGLFDTVVDFRRLSKNNQPPDETKEE